MKCVEELVKEVYDSCKIPFQLTIEEVGEFSTPLFELVQNQSEKSFNYNNTKCCIKVNTALSITLDLLKLYIEERLNKVFLSKKSIVSLLLNDKGIEEEVIKASWPMLIEEFDLINIYVDNYRNEIMSYLKQGYCCKEVEIISHNGHILMFGKFEDILEHAKSIKSTIEGAVPCKAYIGYCNVESYLMLKKYYDDTSYKINLAFKYNIIDRIFDSNKLILEGIIDSVSEEMKKAFRPEFLNRIDETIVFAHLKQEEIRQIVDLMLKDLFKRLAERELSVEVTDEVKDHLAKNGYSEAYGARPLRRLIQRKIEDMLAEEILSGKYSAGDTIVIKLVDDKIAFEKKAKRAKKEQPAETSEAAS